MEVVGPAQKADQSGEGGQVDRLLALDKELQSQFATSYQLRCGCGLPSTDYVLQLNKTLCGICIKEVPNRKELTVDSLGSLVIDPVKLNERLNFQLQSQFVIQSVQQLFENCGRRLEIIKKATLQKLRRHFCYGLDERALEIMRAITRFKSDVINARTEVEKVELVKGLKQVNRSFEDILRIPKQSRALKALSDSREEIDSKLKKIDSALRQLQDLVVSQIPKEDPVKKLPAEMPKLFPQKTVEKFEKLDKLDKQQHRFLPFQMKEENTYSPGFKEKQVKVDRFIMERGKEVTRLRESVDAVCFMALEDLTLKGFIQYQIVDWKGQPEVNLSISVHENGAKVYRDTVQLRRKVCRESKIEIQFNNSVAVRQKRVYDLAIKNLSEPYRTKTGHGAKASPFVSFRKSKWENSSAWCQDGQLFSILFLRCQTS